MNRRVLQILPAPIDPANGFPAYRVAHYSWDDTVRVSLVVAWALVRYGEDEEAYEVVEPVYHSSEDGSSMRVGNTDTPRAEGLPVDVVIATHQDAMSVTWTPSSCRPWTYGSIDVTDEEKEGTWAERVWKVERRPPRPEEEKP